jgi:1-deoxy-D-xylulose-5-phosphate reductoisomerase
MLGLAFDAMREGGAGPALFNAANEVAVKAFVDGRCAFHEIAAIVEMTMNQALGDLSGRSFASLDDVLSADRHGQHLANAIVEDQLHQTSGPS